MNYENAEKVSDLAREMNRRNPTDRRACCTLIRLAA